MFQRLTLLYLILALLLPASLTLSVVEGWDVGQALSLATLSTETLMFVGVLAWLTPLALYDLHHRRVPHIALVAVPYLLAAGYALWRGEWALAVIALVVLGASERYHLPADWPIPVFGLALITSTALCAWVRPESFAGAVAMIGFWMGFELGWWAGADALVAITLASLWPTLNLLVAVAVVHLGLSLIYKRSVPLWRARALRALTPDELMAHGQPGLPALTLSVMVYWVIGAFGH